MPVTKPVTVELPTAAESPTVSVEIGGHALGIRSSNSYRLARTGQLTEGVPVIKVGHRYRVPTAALRRVPVSTPTDPHKRNAGRGSTGVSVVPDGGTVTKTDPIPARPPPTSASSPPCSGCQPSS